MQIEPRVNVSLRDYSTMRLGGPAAFLLDINAASQIGPAIDWAEARNLPVVMIGGGSNIIWNDAGFNGLVLVNKIAGYEVQPQGEQIFITVGAGEPWDSVVARGVNEGLSGIEQLSLIPGNTGATPIQNVGAYGREISEVLVCVQAYDRQEKKVVVISQSDCGFAYRTSRFKTTDKGRFFITSVTLALTKHFPMPPFYDSLEKQLLEHGIHQPNVSQIRAAIVMIRSSKLPDPAVVANCGSFFGNPIVDSSRLNQLIDKHPGLKYWLLSDGQAKISAGWLLEQLGLKGYHEPNTGMAIWDKQALVFVNESAPNTLSLLAFRDAIIKSVQDKFGVTLEQEPELI
ncbi:MAG: UDP-N-acetylmuramate dehydrogenase [Candidatus Saccharimonadales bacterium]